MIFSSGKLVFGGLEYIQHRSKKTVSKTDKLVVFVMIILSSGVKTCL